MRPPGIRALEGRRDPQDDELRRVNAIFLRTARGALFFFFFFFIFLEAELGHR